MTPAHAAIRALVVTHGLADVRRALRLVTEEWDDGSDEPVERTEPRRAPHAGPVELHLLVLCPRPKSTPKRAGAGRAWHTAKPDLDNVVKAVADALVKAGVLRDDVFVAALQARSYVAAADESPRVRLQLHELVPVEVVPWPKAPKRAVEV